MILKYNSFIKEQPNMLFICVHLEAITPDRMKLLIVAVLAERWKSFLGFFIKFLIVLSMSKTLKCYIVWFTEKVRRQWLAEKKKGICAKCMGEQFAW